MLRTARRGDVAAAVAAAGRVMSSASLMLDHLSLSSPAKAGDPVFQRRLRFNEKPRRTGSPAFAGGDKCCMRLRTGNVLPSPPEPFRLARQLDGLHLLELDRALGHQVIEVAVGRASDAGAIEVDLHGAAMVLVGPGRGAADAFHA